MKRLGKFLVRSFYRYGGKSAPRLAETPLRAWERAALFLRQQQTATLRVVEVPLRWCVHYCGFKYGLRDFNPYSNYQSNLSGGLSVLEARRRFIEFLRHYRPKHFGEALGLNLSSEYPLWVFPWEEYSKGDWHTLGYCATPEDCPDLLTHFNDGGISSLRIEEEFVWLEGSLRSIQRKGYQPGKFGPAEVWELQRSNSVKAYIILNGNHRAGALRALGGYEALTVRCASTIKESDAESWPAVREGRMTKKDALAIFAVYFNGNQSWKLCNSPAQVVAPPGWQDLYGCD